MKKIPHTFKLSSEATRMLTELSSSRAIGKTAIIETSIRREWEEEKTKSKPGINPSTGKPFRAFPWETQ